ncbi:MAG: immunoglobulin domain-containing protein [Roseibacillus sp.]
MTKTLFALALACSSLAAAPDTVDLSFTDNAGAYYDANSFGGVASLLVQPDGKLLVGSNWMSAQSGAIFPPLIRFNLDGTVDEDFSADNVPEGSGAGIFYDSSGQPEVHGLALQSDGKIIAVGCMQGMRDGATTGSSTVSLISNGIVRITAAGDPDTTFQSAGIDTEFIDEVITLPNDKIIIAGGFNAVRDQGGSFVSRVGIAQLNADGSLDTGFHLDPASLGSFTTNTLFIRQVAAAPNGKLYIVGSARPAGGTFSDSTPVFARLNADGTVDASFAPVYPSTVTSFQGVVVEPSGDIVAFGPMGTSASSTSYMERFSDSGSPQSSFTLSASLPRIAARPLRVDPLGRYLLSKRDLSLGNSELVRINSDGSLDPTFNASGSWDDAPLGPNNAFFNQSITSPTGKIYAGGAFDHVKGEDAVKIVAFEGDFVPNSPGTIQLGSFAVSASECDGTLRIPVVRIGGATGAATIDYSFTNINASASDYTATPGSLSFANGEAGTKYIEVTLTADTEVENIEVFTVDLTNATGAALGTLTSANAAIIDSNSPPLIGTQPVPLFVAPFQAFQIAVGVISGKDPTTYQWFKDGVAISGATSPLYFQTNANAAQHDGEYCVVVTNPNGSVTSDKVDVVVKEPARLSFAVSSVSAAENAGSVTLTLTRTVSSVNAVSVGLTLTNNTASSADYSISPTIISWADGDIADKTITVTLVDDGDIEPQETFIATLTGYSADAAPGTTTSLTFTILDDDSPLAITSQPSSQTLQEDEVLTLTVAATSQTDLSYQWFLDGAPLAGEVNATLTLDPVEITGAGTYTVEVTNAAGTITSDPAVIAVTPAPYLTTTPPPTPDLDLAVYSIALIDNQTAWVSGNSSTLGQIIQKASLDPSVSPVTITLNSQADQVITLPNGGVAARGFFTTVNGQSQSYVAKFNPDGSLSSGQITTGITTRPDTIAVDELGRILVGEGGGDLRRFDSSGSVDINFPLVSFGSNPQIQSITVDGSSIYVGGRFTSSGAGTAGNYLTKLNPDGTRDEAFVYASNTRVLGIIPISSGRLAVLAQPAVGTVSQTPFLVSASGTVESQFGSLGALSFFDFGIDENEFIYSPRVGGNLFTRRNDNGVFDASFPGFDSNVTTIEIDGAGRVWVGGLFSTLGGNPVPKLVILNGDPSELAIIEEPKLAVAEPGQSASFRVEVISSGTIAYQWRKDGVDLTGETTATLTITSAALADAGLYDVVVTNTDTSLSLTSSPAELVILDAPLIVSSPSSTTQIIGTDLTLTADYYALAPATFQWQKDGIDISGATSDSYDITSSLLGDSGNYTLIVTNGLGSATTTPANIQFIPAPGEFVPGFVPATSGSGSISSIVLESGGGSYLYGNYSAPIHPNGTFNSFFNRVDTTGSPLASFTATSNQSIQDLARDSQGRVILVGSNFFLNGSSGRRIARIDADGVSDTAFDSNAASANFSAIYDVVVDAMDRPIFTGTNSLFRLNTDGTLDSTFTASFSGFSSEMKLDADGKILILTTSNTLLRYENDGTLDSTFTLDSAVPTSPSFITFDLAEDGNIFLAASSSSDRKIYTLSSSGSLVAVLNSPGFTSGFLSDIAVQSNGKILVSVSASPYLARVFPDGSPDPLFDIGTGFNSNVNTIELTEDGNIWVGGSFTQLNGQPVPLYAKFNGDPVDVIISTQPESLIADLGASASLSVVASGLNGAPISYQWLKDGNPIPSETSATLNFASLAETDDSSYEVLITNLTTGRERKSAAAIVTVLGAPELVAFTNEAQNLEIDDELILSVESVGAGTLSYQWQKNGSDIAGANSTTFTIAMSEETDSGDYRVVVTNSFGSLTTDAVTVSVVFSPAAVNFNPDLVFNGTVEAVLPLADGRTLVGGSFSRITFGGINYNIDEIALVNADGTLDTSFDLTPNGTVYTLALDSDGGILIGGRFTFIGGQSRNRVARLNAELTFDTSFGSNIGPNNDVFTFEAAVGGKYFVGGQFSTWDGNPGYLVRLNNDGSYDDTFTPPALNSTRKVIPLSDGKVLAGGAFTGNGVTRVARFNEDGSVDTSYSASSPRFIFDMALQSDGELIAVGDFGAMYRYNPDGTQDNSFSVSVNSSSDIETIAIDSSGRILIGGTFTTVNGESSQSFARLNPDGSTDTTFNVGTGVNSALKAIALQPLGKIWIGGGHSNYRGVTTSRLTLLNGNPLDLAIVQQPVAAVADPGTTATFSVTAVGTDTLTYQWQRNGSDLLDGGDISGTTSNTLSIANVEESDEDVYQVVITHSITMESLTSNPATLVALGAPEILAQPEDVTTENGLTATFTVSAQGASPVSYQWYRDGNILADSATVSGATTAELTLSNLEVSDTSDLFVRISNGLGTLDSDSVSLLVERLPASIDRSVVLPTSVNSNILAIYPFDDGSYLLGGQFTSIGHAGGSASRRYLAKLDTTGTLDTNFPVVVGNGNIRSIEQETNGKFLIAGRFTTLNRNGSFTSHNNIARLNTDGSIDPTFDSLAAPNGDVYVVRPLSDGKILIGGAFSSAGGQTGTAYIARLNTDGSLDSSFVSQATGTVEDIALVGSDYWLTGGAGYPGQIRNVRIDDTGAVASSFAYDGTMSSDDVIPTADGGVVLSADSYPYIEKVDATGTRDTTWPNLANPGGGGPNNRVYELATLGTSRSIVAGTFFSYSGVTAGNIMVVDSTGVPEPDFDADTGFNGSYPLVVKTDSLGRIWCGGSFTSYKDETVNRVVVLNGYAETATDPYLDYLANFTLPLDQLGENDDPDGDNFPNLLEFLYASDPSDGPAPDIISDTGTSIGSDLNTNYPGLSFTAGEHYQTFTVLIPKELQGSSLEVQTSTNLQNFGDGTIDPIFLESASFDAFYDIHTYAYDQPLSIEPLAFARVSATR